MVILKCFLFTTNSRTCEREALNSKLSRIAIEASVKLFISPFSPFMQISDKLGGRILSIDGGIICETGWVGNIPNSVSTCN